MFEQAKAWCTEHRPKVEIVGRRHVHKRGQEAHVFRGKERGQTVRFLAQVSPEGEFLGLIEITNNDRKFIGRSGEVQKVEARLAPCRVVESSGPTVLYVRRPKRG